MEKGGKKRTKKEKGRCGKRRWWKDRNAGEEKKERRGKERKGEEQKEEGRGKGESVPLLNLQFNFCTSLIMARLDTLYSRREHMLQRFNNQNIEHSSSCLINYYQNNAIL